ncbi:MAG: T9SS type A sorting domain-containing protein [Lentimicrobium sp.]|jgi:hypothetical protein|nr:T9SS type A sorting domain-containing protein [Lentimicrobium sp.]
MAGRECFSVDLDSSNNIYSLSEFRYDYPNTNFFDTIPVQPTIEEGSRGLFVTRTDTNYNLQWMKLLETSWGFNSPQMKISPQQKVLIASKVWDRIKVDSIDISFPIHEEAPFVIVQLDSSGHLDWMNLIQNKSYFQDMEDIAFDSKNNTYFTGTIVSDITFGNLNSIGEFLPDTIIVPPINTTPSFIAKYAPDGKFISAAIIPIIHYQGGAFLMCQSMIIDNDDNIYITGWFEGIIQYNNVEIKANGVEIFILKFNKEMELVWSKHFGPGSSTIIQQGNSLAFDKSKKNFYITGNFIGSKDFGNGLVEANDKNIFLAKYTTDGDLKWIKTSGSSSGAASYTEEGQKVFVDNEDFVYLAGEFYNTLHIGDTSLNVYIDPNVSNDYSDFFIAKYLANGKFSWATHAGSNYSDKLGSITKDKNNHVCVCGLTYRGARFGEYTMATNAGTLGFLASFNDRSETNQYGPSYGIEEQKNDSDMIKIFPNPIINNLEVEIQNTNHSDISIQIIDLQGRTIFNTYEKSGNNIQKFSYQFNKKPSGIYCLIITIGNDIYTYKTIKV